MSPEVDFEIDDRMASAEIGDDHLKKVRLLAKRLYNETDLVFRIAPSIVVRGEAELFGLSMPRFACRVYLNQARSSFVNIRRLQLLRHSVRHHLADGSLADQKSKRALRELLGRIGAYSSCCADSLLVPPHALLDEGYHVLTTDLGFAYDEQGEDEREIYGTPYVSHLEIFGGGMCAQAVAFQATALWHNIAKGLYGIAEISMLADPDDAEWIHLGGMTPDKLTQYFRHEQVRLGAQHQYVGGDNYVPFPEQVTVFGDALFSYVSSGMPVVLPIDLGRMNGDSLSEREVHGISIFRRNRLPTILRSGLGPRRRPHAVLIVGAHRTSRQREFIVNDPATYPFLRCSGEQLAQARRYAEGSHDRLGPLSFIPVTPPEIRLPLLNARDELPVQIGLYEIAERLQYSGPREMRMKPSPYLGHFRLFDFGATQSHPNRFQNTPGVRDDTPSSVWNSGDLPTDAVQFLWTMREEGYVPRKWCWVQHRKMSGSGVQAALWIWDACLPPPTEANLDSTVGNYFLGFCVKENGLWSRKRPERATSRCVEAEPQAVNITPELPPRPRQQLRPALISSFAVEGVEAALQNWDPEVGCEVYLLMKADISGIMADPATDTNEFNAVATMERLAGDRTKINRLADKLVASQAPIVAFASFIPEVTSSPFQDRGRRAQGAIRFLARLALAVRERQSDDTRLKVIEMVAGSRISGIYRAEPLPAGDGKEFAYLSRRMPDRDARERMITNLKLALRGDLVSRLREHRISLALEVEPGPLFALRDWTTLQNVALRLSTDPVLAPVVGFNLDIAHWRIGRGNGMLELLRNCDLVRSRITHAHCAGHHPSAHLGDSHLKYLNNPDIELMPWIRMLRLIQEERGSDLPSFSGYVSHEFEAARNCDHVWNSVTMLRDLLVSS